MKRIERLKKNNYTVIHLIGNWFLVRKYSKNFKKFSTYNLKYFLQDC